jgi:hypothetical protein
MRNLETNRLEVVVSAQDPEVQQFKPKPRGLETTLRRLGVDTHQAEAFQHVKLKIPI